MAVKTEKGSEVKDFTTDPVDSDKLLGFKNSDGTRWWSLSRFWNWIKSKTASTITAGDKTPVNSDAVNGALTNVLNSVSKAIWCTQGDNVLFDTKAEYADYNVVFLEITRSVRAEDFGSALYAITYFGNDMFVTPIYEVHKLYGLTMNGYLNCRIENNKVILQSLFSDPFISKLYF